MKDFLLEYWFLVLIVAAFAVSLGVGVREAINYVPPPCITHVPDPERGAYGQCRLGAHVEAVNGVALCVCPEAEAP